MVNNSPPRVPAGLSAESRQICKRVTTEFDLHDVGGQETLRVGLLALDRCERCRKIIDRDGEQIQDRFGQRKPHGLLAAERDARAQYLAALKALNLDVSQTQFGGRSPLDDEDDDSSACAATRSPRGTLARRHRSDVRR